MDQPYDIVHMYLYVLGLLVLKNLSWDMNRSLVVTKYDGWSMKLYPKLNENMLYPNGLGCSIYSSSLLCFQCW